MEKYILITGATDGIGLETAKKLVSLGNRVLLHGRNPAKLDEVVRSLRSLSKGVQIESYMADLSRLPNIELLAKTVTERAERLDVLINNAGIYNAPDPITQEGFDVRFVVNTIAPYLLTQRLMPLLGTSGRVINVSSAAQASVDLKALAGQVYLSAGAAYAQSKLALTMWSRSMALSLKEKDKGPAIVAVNPGSLLGSKLVKDAFGVDGGDIRIGGEILSRVALGKEFATAAGLYFDNDSGRFASPHPDALNPEKCEEVVRVIEAVLTK